jgi:hypothetical protein
MGQINEILVERVDIVRNKRKIRRVNVFLRFENPISVEKLEMLLSFFKPGHANYVYYTVHYRYQSKVTYKAHYLFSDGKRLLIVFAPPERYRFDRYALMGQINEMCSLIHRRLVNS